MLLVSSIAPYQLELRGHAATEAHATSSPYIVKISGLDSGRWHDIEALPATRGARLNKAVIVTILTPFDKVY
ncbi:MAG: hypothetical protein GXP16_00780 [Gammaproteobacteria bacterium]|nr:hypothetical protein [Gammaproteobacteria bacterium]